MIDRQSPVPVYFQIQNDLTQRILRQEWPINTLLPSENDLIKEYNVSRVTLRQALAELEKDKIIKRYRGKRATILGVNPNPFVHELNYKLVNDDKESKENKIIAKILDLKVVEPVYQEIAKKLNLNDGNNKAIYMKRLFIQNNSPIAVGRSWIPYYLVPNLETDGLINNSLSKTLEERFNIIPQNIDDTIEVVRASQNDSSLLNCSMDVPMLLIKGISSLPGEKVVEYSETCWLGDAVRFRIKLFKSNSGFIIGQQGTSC